MKNRLGVTSPRKTTFAFSHNKVIAWGQTQSDIQFVICPSTNSVIMLLHSKL